MFEIDYQSRKILMMHNITRIFIEYRVAAQKISYL